MWEVKGTEHNGGGGGGGGGEEGGGGCKLPVGRAQGCACPGHPCSDPSTGYQVLLTAMHCKRQLWQLWKRLSKSSKG